VRRGSSRLVRCLGPAEQSMWLPRGEERQQQASQVHGSCRTEHVVSQGGRRGSSRLDRYLGLMLNDIPAGDGKTANLFFSVYLIFPIGHCH
jgi:hypothetical protein